MFNWREWILTSLRHDLGRRVAECVVMSNGKVTLSTPLAPIAGHVEQPALGPPVTLGSINKRPLSDAGVCDRPFGGHNRTPERCRRFEGATSVIRRRNQATSTDERILEPPHCDD